MRNVHELLPDVAASEHHRGGLLFGHRMLFERPAELALDGNV